MISAITSLTKVIRYQDLVSHEGDVIRFTQTDTSAIAALVYSERIGGYELDRTIQPKSFGGHDVQLIFGVLLPNDAYNLTAEVIGNLETHPQYRIVNGKLPKIAA